MFRLDVWKLLLSNISRSVQQPHPCMAAADVCAPLIWEAALLAIDSVKS